MKLGFMRGINKYDDQQLEQAILYYAKQYGLRLEFVYPDEELSRSCIKAREEETDTIATLQRQQVEDLVNRGVKCFVGGFSNWIAASDYVMDGLRDQIRYLNFKYRKIVMEQAKALYENGSLNCNWIVGPCCLVEKFQQSYFEERTDRHPILRKFYRVGDADFIKMMQRKFQKSVLTLDEFDEVRIAVDEELQGESKIVRPDFVFVTDFWTQQFIDATLIEPAEGYTIKSTPLYNLEVFFAKEIVKWLVVEQDNMA